MRTRKILSVLFALLVFASIAFSLTPFFTQEAYADGCTYLKPDCPWHNGWYSSSNPDCCCPCVGCAGQCI
jgi:hypothetical protein